MMSPRLSNEGFPAKHIKLEISHRPLMPHSSCVIPPFSLSCPHDSDCPLSDRLNTYYNQ